MFHRRWPAALAMLVFACLLAVGGFGTRGRAAEPPTLEATWGADGLLTLTGFGFLPYERLQLSLTVQSMTVSESSGPGVYSQSSQSSAQSTMLTVDADGDGRLSSQMTLFVPDGAELIASATGEQGSYAELRTTLTRAG
jgi:hypothetical protein